MKKEKLAIFGGPKSFNDSIKTYNTIGKEELRAAIKVVKSGKLSSFLGEPSDEFFGGKYVRQFEKNLSKYFKVKYAITVNSWSSGLSCAVGALDLNPGDEVILPTMTMCACASAILQWNLVPVFADVDPNTFNICSKSIEKKITNKTRAIMAVDYFGRPADMKKIIFLAKKYNLKTISDTAQAIGAKYHGKYAGTLADIGGFSLNYHKTIHTGEGGILVTNNPKLALRLQLIRNHAEAVVKKFRINKISGLIGRNYRLGEIEAAIGIEQLKKLKYLVKEKQNWANQLIKGLSHLDGLSLPIVPKEMTHSYYAFPMKVNTKKLKVSKNKILNALRAEGVPWISGELTLIHKLPIFQKKIAYGNKNFPWRIGKIYNPINYKLKSTCPVAEEILHKNYINIPISLLNFNKTKINKVIKAFNKVWSSLDKL
tara:strand:+ start:21 stop:1301 length:1281 start_codon:yes stop_codon:yes gene_type:complete